MASTAGKLGLASASWSLLLLLFRMLVCCSESTPSGVLGGDNPVCVRAQGSVPAFLLVGNSNSIPCGPSSTIQVPPPPPPTTILPPNQSALPPASTDFEFLLDEPPGPIQPPQPVAHAEGSCLGGATRSQVIVASEANSLPTSTGSQTTGNRLTVFRLSAPATAIATSGTAQPDPDPDPGPTRTNDATATFCQWLYRMLLDNLPAALHHPVHRSHLYCLLCLVYYTIINENRSGTPLPKGTPANAAAEPTLLPTLPRHYAILEPPSIATHGPAFIID
jgi:hypothetical protein